MKIEVLNQSILEFAGDLLIVNLFEGVRIPGGATGAVDRTLGGFISKLIKNNELTGKLGETVVFYTMEKIPAAKVMVLGLGKSENFGIAELRQASGAAAMQAKKIKARRVGTIVHGAGIAGLEPELASRALTEGTVLALYEFQKFQKAEVQRVEEFYIVEMDKQKINKFEEGVKLGKVIAESQNIARDLINEPANSLTPQRLSQRIKEIIKQFNLEEKLECEVLNKKGIEDLKMGAFLAVGQGSDNEPRFIILRYKNADTAKIALIGKTITFDSGGISLKQPEGMARMKGDMSGGAVVFATLLALARTNTKINALALIPAAENMPSAKASRPGDVVRAMNGKTIEIISTDAEGRMTIADAICYAEKEGAEIIIDIATLTGGSVIAFGDVTAAVMGNDQRLVNGLLNASRNTGEHLWQMPLFEEYEDKLKSDVADIKNSGGRNGSPITAGVFLKSFVSRARWIHIDIAGKEFADKESFYQPKGATGFGVRTLVEFCQKITRDSGDTP